jgi:pimeloyl-ACP methyl ester carboxylesterase
LHAAAGDHRAPFDRLRMHHHLAQAVGADGVPPFVLASADGGGSSWRPAATDDPFAMLLEELAPLLAALGLRTSDGALGVAGWSMGGAGALRLAEAHPGAADRRGRHQPGGGRRPRQGPRWLSLPIRTGWSLKR